MNKLSKSHDAAPKNGPLTEQRLSAVVDLFQSW